MENKPITNFLKFMSLLTIIVAIWSLLAGILAIVTLVALPGFRI